MSGHFLKKALGLALMGVLTGCAAADDATMGSYLTLEYDEAIEEELTKVCGANSSFRGIDVSKWQGDVDWSKVASDAQDIKFAIARVSDGLNFSDAKFDRNYQGIKDAGLIRGVYQFFRPSQDPIKQADYLLEKIGVKLEANDLPPVIDVEADEGLTAEEIVAAVTKWVNRVESKLGVKPIIYTGGHFWDNHVKSAAFAEYPLWHAAYPNTWTSASCPSISESWSKWAIWQYSAKATINGISGNVDINVVNGSLGDLQKLTYGASCAKIPVDGRIIDESDSCFYAGGKAKYLRQVTDAGYNGGLIWSKTWVTATASNYGKWNFNFERGGTYSMDYYLSNQSSALTDVFTEVPYKIMHDGRIEVVTIDQSNHEGWKEVGTFYFAQGGGQYLLIDDMVSDKDKAGKQFLLDAVRLVPQELDVDPREVCVEIPAQGRVIDETEACFVGGGDPKWLRSLEDIGYQKHLIWSNSEVSVGSAATSTGTYNLIFAEAGAYELLVYIPIGKSPISAKSGKAIGDGVQYAVKYGASISELTINQSSATGWFSLGSFEFAVGDNQYVMVKDAVTDESYCDKTFIMDAIKLNRISGDDDNNSNTNPGDLDDPNDPLEPVEIIFQKESTEEEPSKGTDFFESNNNNSTELEESGEKPLVNGEENTNAAAKEAASSDSNDTTKSKRGCNSLPGDPSTLLALLGAIALLRAKRRQSL